MYTDYATVLSNKLSGGNFEASSDSAVKNVHVVIEVRSINPSKKNNHSSARHISNLQDLLRALRAISVSGVRGAF